MKNKRRLVDLITFYLAKINGDFISEGEIKNLILALEKFMQE